MTFEVAGVVATASEAAARVRHHRADVQVAGLSCVPPLTFVPHHGACGVPSRLAVCQERFVPLHDLRGLVVSFRDTDHSVRSVRFSGSCRASPTNGERSTWAGPPTGLLSWGCQDSPLHRHGRRASTPSHVLPKGAATFGPGLPCPGLVPSLSFLPTSTVSSARRLAGLLHPAADPGVRHVSSTHRIDVSRARPITSSPVSPPCRGHSASTLAGRSTGASSPGRLSAARRTIPHRRPPRVTTLPPTAPSGPPSPPPFLRRVAATSKLRPTASPRPADPHRERRRSSCGATGPGIIPAPLLSPVALHPSELFPTSAAASRHRDPCPLAVVP